MPIDNRTATLNLPKPNIANALSDDVGRLEAALDGLDAALAGKLPRASVSVFGLTLVDDADSATARGTLGLGNVENTSDTNKPVSTAQAAADIAAINEAKAYANGLVVGLWDDRGSYNASVNTYPAAGGSGTAGAVLKGDIWTISVAGTLGGAAVSVGDSVRAVIDAPAQIAVNWAVLENNIGYLPENAANKNASNGYAGLTLFNLNLRNAADTITSWFTTAATAARAWTMPDKDGTVAMTSDITGVNSGTNTGDQVLPAASATTPAPLGTAAVGVATTFARGDHVHLQPTLATLGAQAAGTYATGTGTASGTNTGDQDLSAMVTLAGTQTLTNKAITATVFRETKIAISSVLDVTAGNLMTRTVTANTTFAFSAGVPAAGIVFSFILDLTNGGAFTITWPTAIKWAGGTAPTLTTAGRDMLGFVTHDGGTIWSGLVLGRDVK